MKIIQNTKNYTFAFSTIAIILLLISLSFISYIVSLRPLDFGPDTTEYFLFFNAVLNSNPLRINELGFFYLTKLIGLISDNYLLFFFSISLLSNLLTILVLVKISKYNNFSRLNFVFFCFFVFGLYFISPFYLSGQINIIRHYLSLPLLILSFLNYGNRNYFSVILLVIASLIHVSNSIFLILIFLLRIQNKNLIKLYLMVFLSYVSGFSYYISDLVLSLYSPGLMETLTSSPDYNSGVRLDFAFFDFVFFIFIFCIKNIEVKVNLQKMYIILSLPFLLIGFIDFSDRLLVPVFYMIPIICGFVLFNFSINVAFKLFFSFSLFFLSMSYLFSNLKYLYT